MTESQKVTGLNMLNRGCSELAESRRAERKKQSLLQVNKHFSVTRNAESANSDQALATSKTIGLIGGLSWASTSHYYEKINRETNHILGGQASANLLISSLDFQPIITAQTKNNWEFIEGRILNEIKLLKSAGVDFFAIASNTIHYALRNFDPTSILTVNNIFDAVADECKAKNISKICLIGTRYTMTFPFFKNEYERRGIKCLTPSTKIQTEINQWIFKELIHGIASETCLRDLIKCCETIISDLPEAQAIVLGCTELSVLGPIWRLNVPSIDTTEIHCKSIVAQSICHLS
ncbi:MAG: amino acid racemase [Proteobacteria bacterium]|nr:amino acid racemase [Pseudomonadota bacterium]